MQTIKRLPCMLAVLYIITLACPNAMSNGMISAPNNDDINRMVQLLGPDNKNPFLCILAGESLKQNSNDKIVEQLVRVVKDKKTDPFHCANVVEVLGEIGDVRSVKPLLKILKNEPATELTITTVRALGKMRDQRAVEPLLGILKNHYSEWVKIVTANALGDIGDPIAIKALIVLSESEKNPVVVTAIAKTLATMGSPARKQLVLMAQDDRQCEKHWRLLAEAFSFIRVNNAVDDLVAISGDNNVMNPIRIAAFEALGEISDSNIPRLLTNSFKMEDSEVIRIMMAHTLVKQGSLDGTHIFIDVLKSQNALGPPELYETAVKTARLLGQIGDSKTKETLLAMIENDLYQGKVRLEIVLAISLGELKVCQAIPWLVNLLNGYNEAAFAAAEALGKIGGRQSMTYIISAVKNGTEEKRLAALRALTNGWKSDIVDSYLIDALQDKSPEIRVEVARLLGQIKATDAIPYLVGAIKTESCIIKHELEVSPKRLQSAHIYEPLNLGPLMELAKRYYGTIGYARDAASQSLVSMGTPSVKALREIVSDQTLNPCIRSTAALALSDIGDTRGVEPIRNLSLESNLQYQSAYCDVAYALGKFRDEKSAEGLIAILLHGYGQDVNNAVERALLQIGSPAVTPLKNVVSNDSIPEWRREDAIKILQELSDLQIIASLLNKDAKTWDYEREAVLLGIIRVGPPAVDLLVPMVNEEYLYWRLRNIAASALSSIGSPYATEALQTAKVADF